ncbi:MAG: ATP-binding protein [Desulfopila sp.]
MIPAMSLRAKITCIFTVIAVIVIAGSGSLFWYTHQTDQSVSTMIEREVLLYKEIQDMELALANQKGFLTYYFVDGDEKWLAAILTYRRMFGESMLRATSSDLTPANRQALELIGQKYANYIAAKDQAIDNYKKGLHQQSISMSHERQRDAFFGLLALCEEFSQQQWRDILQREREGIARSQRMRFIVSCGLVAFVATSVIFLVILYRQILVPIRGLAIETGGPQEDIKNEVNSLAHSLQDMRRDFDETASQLARSQRTLMQAERMATVGELAAGVAHTIRNPFTSIKMRMFSLGRTLALSDQQNEDLQVIAEEIARIDKIVQNFLEFARPPKLRLENCRLHDIIHSVLVLLDYRIRKFEVELRYTPRTELPPVRLDPDRIKEALVNLIVNSCEAMEPGGGTITVGESRGVDPRLGPVVILTVTDTGPGVPETIIDKITTPFFTTKDQGSGIGLSIVARIVQEHDGQFMVSSAPDKGTESIIFLPVGGGVYEYDTDHR